MGRATFFGRVYREVSLRQRASFIPEGWAKKWHLDVVALQTQRTTSKEPFAIKGYEIKSCRADFLADKKWKNYLDRVDWFIFVALPGIIKPEDIEGTKAGLSEIQIHKTVCYDPNARPDAYGTLHEIVRPHREPIPQVCRFDTIYGLAINDQMLTKYGETSKQLEQRRGLQLRYLGSLQKGKDDG